MKGYEKWADEHARKWNGDCASNDIYAEQLERDKKMFIAGFRCGREHAANMIQSFNNPKFDNVPLLIRAIGERNMEDVDNG